ncbi:MAG: MarR family winged helix-turn-helix transcriptional regulator [Solirubrobacterales bacterium]
MGDRYKSVMNILDALECANEALALMPQMPANVKPIYLRILYAIYKIGEDTGSTRVSDISKVSGVLLPNATKAINEMVELNIVRKFNSALDKRVVLVRPTDLGTHYIKAYVHRFIEGLEDEFSKINEADCVIMIDTIQKVFHAMRTVYTEEEAAIRS